MGEQYPIKQWDNDMGSVRFVTLNLYMCHCTLQKCVRQSVFNDRISSVDSKDTDPSVLINGHFDSPLGSPGASDCGSCVGEQFKYHELLDDVFWQFCS